MSAPATPQPRPSRPLTTIFGWRGPEWILDYGPVAFIAFEGLAAIVIRPHPGRDAVLLVLGLLASVAVLVRRHEVPLVALAVTLAVALLTDYGGVSMLPVLLAVFTLAEYRDRRTVLFAVILALLSVLITPALHDHPLQTISQFVSRAVAIGMAVAVGLYLRARADYVLGLQERADRLERERELLAQQAVADERLRIARELHDVVAHNVSLMVVQAQALAATGEEPAERRDALRRVGELGREAMSEMHRMLGVLRLETGGAAEREPQPGVADLERLVARTREAGLVVELRNEGAARDVSPGVDLSAYRIVQEALTNVVRHADARRAEVTLRYTAGALELAVRDDGRAGANGSAGAGHGLVGMRERVTMLGGELRAGPRTDGPGYEVNATLPLH